MRKFRAFIEKKLDLYLCKSLKIMAKVIMSSATYGNFYLWQKYLWEV